MDLQGIPVSEIPPAHVSQMPQRSPLRYPGGKTWLMPHIRHWLRQTAPSGLHPLFAEPFAGGATASLLAVSEGFAARALLIEIDPDVAAFWRAALRHGPELAELVQAFRPTPEEITRISRLPMQSDLERGFWTLVRNRTQRGGILAPGAASLKKGENGRGLASRWYARTLLSRLEAIHVLRSHIEILQGDGVAMTEILSRSPGTALFLDPPYPKKGKRLYQHGEVDHFRLFQAMADSEANFLMSSGPDEEIQALVRRFGFQAATIQMKSAHHQARQELLISREPLFAKPMPKPDLVPEILEFALTVLRSPNSPARDPLHAMELAGRHVTGSDASQPSQEALCLAKAHRGDIRAALTARSPKERNPE